LVPRPGLEPGTY